MLARARARVTAPHVRFVRHDLRRPLPLAAAAADLVVVSLVLEHLERLEPVFTECARVLRPGGALFVCELHPFRQLAGAQARFVDAGEEARIPAFLHDLSDYLAAALGAGLTLAAARELRDDPATRADAPRVVALTLRRPGGA
ncbi:MAG: methyltransferase domain-containing protein [Planctomycetes bacterium]|nr:methyltransferase domain-containing protein [Planctomycetota bacterium]